MRYADGSRVLGFKGLQLASEQKPAGIGDATVGGVELNAEFSRGGFKIEKGQGHQQKVVRS
jgi:hypothetical protein